MKYIIGVTGGVGAGKSQVLSYLKNYHNGEILIADEIAHEIMAPHQDCYQKLVEFFGSEILCSDGQIDKQKMSQLIFAEAKNRLAVNRIVHPEVKHEILKRIEKSDKPLIVVEAALFIEAGYRDICHQLWYIYVPEQLRIERLMRSRGYSREKSEGIIASQLSEQEFRKHCQVVIDNSGTEKALYAQLEMQLKNINR